MTQPPSQGPHGQQPGGQPHGPYSQQPGGPPPGGYQQGGPPQPPHDQGVPPGYGPPPGGGEKKSPLPWILGGLGALVLIGGVVALVLVLLSGPGDPRDTAQKAVDGINARDVTALTEVTCEKEKSKVQESIDQLDLSKNPDIPAQLKEQLKGIKITTSLGEVKEVDDKNATAQVTIKVENVPAQFQQFFQNPPPMTMKLVDEDGWKVCDIDTATS